MRDKAESISYTQNISFPNFPKPLIFNLNLFLCFIYPPLFLDFIAPIIPELYYYSDYTCIPLGSDLPEGYWFIPRKFYDMRIMLCG